MARKFEVALHGLKYHSFFVGEENFKFHKLLSTRESAKINPSCKLTIIRYNKSYCEPTCTA